MISRRNYFTMSIMMFVLLFLFQATKVIQESSDSRYENQYFNETANDGETEINLTFSQQERSVAYIGATDTKTYDMVRQWCAYSKRPMTAFDSFEDMDSETASKIEMVLVDGREITVSEDINSLEDFTANGVSVVFVSLPKASEIKNSNRFCDFCGIREVVDERKDIQGIYLYEGFLLGGEKEYRYNPEEPEAMEGIELTIPWYRIGQGTQPFVIGLLSAEEAGDEDNYVQAPPVIWRNKQDQAFVYCINGDYMSDYTALGFLSAIASDMEPYSVYPVLNAQSISVVNYPGFADENVEKMQELYSRSQGELYRDVILPSLIAFMRQGGSKISAFLTPQTDYADGIEPDDEMYSFYMQQLYSENSEAGISLALHSDVSMSEKQERDFQFYRKQADNYQFGAIYLTPDTDADSVLKRSICKDVTTLVYPMNSESDLISFHNNDVTEQLTTADGFHYNNGSDLLMRSLQTALGYSNVNIDMNEVAWPETEDQQWEKVYDRFARVMNTHWKPFENFSKTTASVNDQRIRALLSLDYSHSQEDNVVRLQVENYKGTTYFILRTHGKKIEQVQGGGYTEIEEGVYLLRIERAKARVTLTKDKEDGMLIY